MFDDSAPATVLLPNLQYLKVTSYEAKHSLCFNILFEKITDNVRDDSCCAWQHNKLIWKSYKNLLK